jgi:23S rRNA G2069 N7-methylase RlmK/C1962 C5-methylase RlmI
MTGVGVIFETAYKKRKHVDERKLTLKTKVEGIRRVYKEGEEREGIRVVEGQVKLFVKIIKHKIGLFRRF